MFLLFSFVGTHCTHCVSKSSQDEPTFLLVFAHNMRELKDGTSLVGIQRVRVFDDKSKHTKHILSQLWYLL